jgi:hypothetical protein
MDDQTALRMALGDFRVALTPDIAERIAAASLRLAACCYAIAKATRTEGDAAGATELLLILADRVEEPPPSMAAAA